jgi:hypothetical protein
MDLWGEEAKPASKVEKLKKTLETKKEPEKSEVQKVYIEGLSERSTQEAWQIWARKIDDDIKTINIRQSEIRELREYVSRNEARLSNIKTYVDDALEGINKRIISVENFVQEATKILEQINQALGE